MPPVRVHVEVTAQSVKTPRSTRVGMISAETPMYFPRQTIRTMPPCTLVAMIAASESATGPTIPVVMDKLAASMMKIAVLDFSVIKTMELTLHSVTTATVTRV